MNNSSDNQTSFILNINKYVVQEIDATLNPELSVVAAISEILSGSVPKGSNSSNRSPSLTSSKSSPGVDLQHNDTISPIKLTVSCAYNAYLVYKEILKIVSSDEDFFKLNLNIKRDIDLVNSFIIICLTSRTAAQKLFQILHNKYRNQLSDITLKFNYDLCISHPGNIFIKNLSTNLISEQELLEHFQRNSKYKSLNSVKLFPQDNNESFAFLNFNNHLDADYLIKTSSEEPDSNPFHQDPKRPIYVNRYISKKERKLRQQSKDFVNEELEMNFNGISINSPPVSPPSGLQPNVAPAQHPSTSSNNSSSMTSNSHDYSTIFIENLGQFVNEVNPTIESIDRVLNKFEIFGEISSAYFPLVPVEEYSEAAPDFRLANFGYINFEHSENNINSLRALYYLSDLSPSEFFKFSKKDIYDIKDDMLFIKELEQEDSTKVTDSQSLPAEYVDEDQFELSDADSGTPGTENSQGSASTGATSVSNLSGINEPNDISSVKLQLAIGQHKHNPNLYQYNPEQFAFTTGLNADNSSTIEMMSPQLHNKILNTFLKKSNYQETNIYVNNFPVLFDNDDLLWESFWIQFGNKSSPNNGIKSARIIKPQFYSKNGKDNASINSNNLVGKIGFVFYQDFKMALRAVILTNNKNIITNDSDSEEHRVSILTSFALQKSSHNNTHNNSHSGISIGSNGGAGGSFNFGSVGNGNNSHYFNSIPAYKRFSLPSLLPNGSTNTAVVAAAAAAAAAALQQQQQQQHQHQQQQPLPRGDSMMNWQPFVPPADYLTYFYNPYVNFTYGYPAGFIPSRMSFDQDKSPNAGPEGEDYVEALETSSPPNGLHAPYYQSPPVTSPIFNEAYLENHNVPQPHPMLYGAGIPQSAQGPPPHMMPIYPYYSSNSISQNAKGVSGKKIRLKERD